ncbi:U1 small nuclear ribonucleoprotein A [Coprinopsis cinerea okayama7|uniref:U1 small nuclear ribonucleoprotein A n=1 Tax=Coprinopsis cinerea (strain Okayama-7 / 130 / ATCC MYA-4618 / FGSC 9003) TaxID=240176 RepID=A8NXC1_COPC7|nr:U1 small nuclear ribonucleoprotein A [Coprinopsis cinerea okayama7\|eukprot:XP_001837125.2 U1 small nuclear ribonucleoprotein A [Coprinopsis cinerea okayama7\
MANSQPNPTLYINNLNEKITKEELKTQLYALFTTYGRIIDIVASKGPKMRGQAFLVFADLAGATTAMRACEGMLFYDKPMRITYAKTKSYATLSREDPNFVPPNAANASSLIQNGKRTRDEDKSDERQAKREKSDESSDEEMEIEDDDEAPSNAQQTNACMSILYISTIELIGPSILIKLPMQPRFLSKFNSQPLPCCAPIYRKRLRTMFCPSFSNIS